jgi:hypothetical protein
MSHIEGVSRSHTLLLPEAVDDYVDADNPVRFIDAFVDELDLEKAGFSHRKLESLGRKKSNVGLSSSEAPSPQLQQVLNRWHHADQSAGAPATHIRGHFCSLDQVAIMFPFAGLATKNLRVMLSLGDAGRDAPN